LWAAPFVFLLACDTFTVENILAQCGYRQLIGHNDTNFCHNFLMPALITSNASPSNSTFCHPISLAKTTTLKTTRNYATAGSITLPFGHCNVANTSPIGFQTVTPMPIFRLWVSTTSSQFTFTSPAMYTPRGLRLSSHAVWFALFCILEEIRLPSGQFGLDDQNLLDGSTNFL
jgi:hypothetical protein